MASLRSLLKADKGVAIPMTGKIRPALGEVTSPESFYRSEFIGISRTGSGYIDLDTSEVGDELVLSPVSDDLVGVLARDLNLLKVVFL